MTKRRFLELVFSMVALVGLAVDATAHDPGLSIAEVTLGERVVVRLVYPRGDFDAVFARRGSSASLDEVAGRAVLIRVDGRDPVTADVTSVKLDEGDVRFELMLDIGAYDRLEITSSLIAEFPRGHRQYMTVRDECRSMLTERMLDRENHTLVLETAELCE